MKRPLVLATSLAIGVTLGGCVSTSKYKKLEADRNGVKSQYAAEAAKSAALEQQVADLKNAASSLSQEKEALEKTHEDTTSQYQNLVDQLQKEVQDGQLKVTQFKNMLTVDVAEKLFFDSGSAKLKQSGKDVLGKVAGAMAAYPDKFIRVVGHTDNVPLAKSYQAIFPTNWELSVIRATNVVRFLQEQGKIAPERLIASGRGEFDPIATNTTAEGRQKNRRIEITLIDKSVMDSQQTSGQPASPAPAAAPMPTPLPTDGAQ